MTWGRTAVQCVSAVSYDLPYNWSWALTLFAVQGDTFGCTTAGSVFRKEGSERRAKSPDIQYRKQEGRYRECQGTTATAYLAPSLRLGQLADSMKRFNYLLGQTELFQHFIDLKVS